MSTTLVGADTHAGEGHGTPPSHGTVGEAAIIPLSLVGSGRYNRRMSNALSERLLSWYRHNARDLPWRGTGDPYVIWVAEVMLQQTRVETVLPYYQRWMDRFPGPKALAEADSDELMSAWEGLGYYRRARLLQRAAKRILARLIDLDLDPRSPEGEARLMACATSLLPTGQASAFNQALMDLGATICLPRSPAFGAYPNE